MPIPAFSYNATDVVDEANVTESDGNDEHREQKHQHFPRNPLPHELAKVDAAADGTPTPARSPHQSPRPSRWLSDRLTPLRDSFRARPATGSTSPPEPRLVEQLKSRRRPGSQRRARRAKMRLQNDERRDPPRERDRRHAQRITVEVEACGRGHDHIHGVRDHERRNAGCHEHDEGKRRQELTPSRISLLDERDHYRRQQQDRRVVVEQRGRDALNTNTHRNS